MKTRGLDHEIVKAIDGSALTDDEIETLCDTEAVARYPEWLSRGMIGAALSHRKVYARIMESEERAALVLEDDAILPRDIREILDSLDGCVRDGEVVLLHYSSRQSLRLSNQNSQELANGSKLMYPMNLKGLASAVCYVITRNTARSLHRGVLPIASSPDSWIDFVERGCLQMVRCVFPGRVGHLGVKSTISATTQGPIRRFLTGYIDDHKLPILNDLLKSRRQSNVASRSKVRVTDEASPLASRR